MKAAVQEYFTDLFNLFYPNVCLSCSKTLLKGEEVLCFKCENELPQTGYWNQPDNRLAQRFWGRVPLQGCVALFKFHKGGEIQNLLHALKYKGRKEAGEYCGAMLGQYLKQSDSVIQNIDLIVPVPLHWKKEKMRGYNQCEPFAKGLSKALDVPYSLTALERIHENTSQTKKSKFERFENVSQIFGVKDAKQLEGKHVLLVDDVVTTGATAEACLQTILSVPETKVSFAAIATAVI